jgi:CRISPR system Cascade subunit CasC
MPKTCEIGGATRLRISSQCLKRAWRTSPIFEEAVGNFQGFRTRNIGEVAYDKLRDLGMSKTKTKKAAGDIAKVFGDTDKEEREEDGAEIYRHTQVVHYTPREAERIDELIETLAEENRRPDDDEESWLIGAGKAADVAMFGRMMADDPGYNVEAAVQVSHAFTTSAVPVEDDFFTAVDDVNDGFASGDFFDSVEDINEEAGEGSAHMGVKKFGSGVFYTYININLDQLVDNLEGDRELADRAVRALVRAAMTVSPSGSQNSYAAHSPAQYALLEKGSRQPVSLASAAYQDPVSEQEPVASSIEALREAWRQMNEMLGKKRRVESVAELNLRELEAAEGPIDQDEVSGEGRIDEFVGNVNLS